MDLLALASALFIMGSIVFGLIGVYQMTANPRGAMQRRLGSVLGETQGMEVTAADFEGLRPTKVGKTPILSSLLSGRSWTAQLIDDLEKADIKLTASEFISMRVMLALVAAAIPLVILGRGPLGLLATGIATFIAYMLPGFYVNFAKGRRVKKLETQLIEALSLMANSLKAGFGLLQSFELVARQMEHPIATEIRRTLHDINVGSQTDAALHSLAQRSGSRDFDIVVTAMLIQQSTGGNLSEILDNVAHTMRERVRIRGEISTLTSQQMLTGFIIGALPFFMAAGFSVLSPTYMTPLFHSLTGNLLLVGAGVLELFGILVIKKILAIEV